VPVTHERYAGVFHSFFTEVLTYRQARRAVSDACERLRAAFTAPGPREVAASDSAVTSQSPDSNVTAL
jgi:hypothetical protein